jgi:hypothetical protein
VDQSGGDTWHARTTTCGMPEWRHMADGDWASSDDMAGMVVELVQSMVDK